MRLKRNQIIWCLSAIGPLGASVASAGGSGQMPFTYQGLLKQAAERQIELARRNLLGSRPAATERMQRRAWHSRPGAGSRDGEMGRVSTESDQNGR